MSDSQSTNKIGAGHASAMLRLGLRELRGSLYPESNVAQPAELGVYGTATPHEVHQARQWPEADLGPQNDSILEDRMSQAQGMELSSRDNLEMDKE